MRVLIFCYGDLSLGSGSEVRTRLIAKGLRQLGATVGVVARGVPDNFAALGITTYSLPSSSTWLTDLTLAAQQFKPDIIYGVTEAGTDVVRRVARMIGSRLAYDLHGIGLTEIWELGWGHGSQLARSWRSLHWLRQVPYADLVTVANPTLVPLVRWMNKHTLPIIGMLDISRFTPIGPVVQLGTDPAKIQVLYAGNFFKWQGVHLLIGAIKQLLKQPIGNQFEFTILGSVGKIPSIQRLVERWKEELPAGQVHFLDSVDFDQIANYYRGADVLVIPRPFMLSTYLALPQKLTEYMAIGKAVVATSLAPHRWALANPPAGILCAPTPRGIAEGIIQSADRQLRTTLSATAHQQSVQRFAYLQQCQKIYDAFAKLIHPPA